MTSIAADVRQALATSLSSVVATVYNHVPEAIIPPAVVCVPSDPYFEIVQLGKATFRTNLNFTVTAMVAYNSNPAALDNLEKLVISILSAMPDGWVVGTVSRPSIQRVGAIDLLVADIPASTNYEQIN